MVTQAKSELRLRSSAARTSRVISPVSLTVFLSLSLTVFLSLSFSHILSLFTILPFLAIHLVSLLLKMHLKCLQTNQL